MNTHEANCSKPQSNSVEVRNNSCSIVAPETASDSQVNRHQTVVSSADGAKVCITILLNKISLENFSIGNGIFKNHSVYLWKYIVEAMLFLI
jgi:hypothetical protein